VPKSIAGETTMKMMHKEGIRRRYVRHKEMCIYGEIKCDALDIKVQNSVHKQDLCTIQKTTRESDVSILKRLYLSDISCGT
jgi:hypothetical protein